MRFGYDFAQSDQDEFLPSLLHRLNNNLFEHDWFVQIQASEFGVRTLFVRLLEGMCAFFPVWFSVLSIYLLAWLLVATAIYSLTDLLTRNRVVAVATVVAALVFTPHWTLGGNELVSSMLVPSMLGWGLGLWGVYHVFKERMVWAAIFMGLATWMQALVGLQLAGVFFFVQLTMFINPEKRSKRIRSTVWFSSVFLIVASVALLPLLYHQIFSSRAIPSQDIPNLFYIMAVFRAPHHYLFQAFPEASFLRFGALAGLAILFLMSRTFKKQLFGASLILRILGTVILLCSIGYLFSEIWPILFITKLQLFKLTVFAKLLFLIVIFNSVAHILPKSLGAWLRDRAEHPSLAFVMLAIWTIVLVGFATDKPLITDRIQPVARIGSPNDRLERWVRNQTPTDAVFAVPPSYSAFRSNAQRAIVADFKAFPFGDVEMTEWFKRITDFAGGPLPQRGGPALQAQLDDSYEVLNASRLKSLAQTYGVSYIVRSTGIHRPNLGLEIVYSNTDWRVYRIPTHKGH